MSYTVVIPSRTLTNLTACIAALRAAGEMCRVIVVDDGLSSDSWTANAGLWACVEGQKPFVFARNVNIGIRAAGADDVIVLNDDALLKTRDGFARLARDVIEHPEYGIIAPGVDWCGTQNQLYSAIQSGLRDEKVMLAFICAYIPRRTIDLIGLLDERFAVNAGGPGARGYGLEDDDYCWRVRGAGLKLGVQNDVFVTHTELPSTFRGDPAHPANVFAHEALFAAKWGKHPRIP